MARLKVPPFESKKTDWTTLLVGFALGCFLVLLLVIVVTSVALNNNQTDLPGGMVEVAGRGSPFTKPGGH